MRRYLYVIVVISFLCCTGFTNTYSLQNYDNNNTIVTYEDNNYEVMPLANNSNASQPTCKSLFGDKNDPQDPAYWIQLVLRIIGYLGIVFLLVFSTIDFVKATVEQNHDAIQKAAKKSLLRFVYAVLIFFIPVVVSFLMAFAGLYDNCNFEIAGGDINVNS